MGPYALAPGSCWLRPAPGLVAAGLGSGVLTPALARLAVGSVPARRAATGSGADSTARYLDASLGVAVTVAVAGSARPVASGPADTGRAVLVAAGL